MTDRQNPLTERVESLHEAVEKATYADRDENGFGCTRPFVVDGPECQISVVRKHTFERGSYFLFTVRAHVELSETQTENVIQEIEAALGMKNSDVTVTVEEHDNGRLTCIVPTEFAN